MAVKVMIPTALRQLANGQDTLDLNGENVGQVLQQLGETFPELRQHIFSDEGAVRNFINVFVNDQNIRDMDNLETTLTDGDELTLIPAVAGGNTGGGRFPVG